MKLGMSKISSWIINLDRNHDRWIRCFRSLSAVLPAERIHRISAIDGRKFIGNREQNCRAWNPAEAKKLQDEKLLGISPLLDPVRTALCLSNQQALHAFLQSGEPWALIFEDDARPAEAMVRLLVEQGQIAPPEDFEILFLHDRVQIRGASQDPSESGNFDGLRWRVVRGGFGLEAYLVSIEGARKMLQVWKPVFMECDLQLMAFLQGYPFTETQDRIKKIHADCGGEPVPAIQAYAPHRPLFQTDHWVPSVKFATIQEGACTTSPPPERRLFYKDLQFNLNHKLGLAVVWFNPARYRSRVENFRRFSEGLQKFHDRMLTVELAFGDEPWQLPETPNIIRLRSNTVCWQKEALLNFAFEQLSRAGFDYLAWIDADILFPNDTWYERSIEVLKKRRLCQLFSEVETHFPGVGRTVETGIAHLWTGSAASPFWESARLFDFDLMGGGDYTMWHGVFANYLTTPKVFWNRTCSDDFRKVRAEWAGRWSKAIALEIGYVEDNLIKALPHGNARHRLYQAKNEITKRHRYSPLEHVERDEFGLLRWTDQAPVEFRNEVQNYFFEHCEDLDS